MNVGIAYAKPMVQIWRTIQVPDGVTVRDVIEVSGFLDDFPELDLETNKVGIFGTIVKLDRPVHEGDRVEIYRAIYPEAELLEKTK